MLSISKNESFMNEILKGANITQSADIVFKNGSSITLIADDFSITGNSLVDGAGASTLPIGYAIQKVVTLTIFNFDDKFSIQDFYDASVRLYSNYSNMIIDYGIYTVTDATTTDDVIMLTIGDKMYLADMPFVTSFGNSSIQSGCTISALLNYCCSFIGVTPRSTIFFNSDFIVTTLPTDCTFRQVLGWIAQLAAGNIRIGYDGKLDVLTYDFHKLSILNDNLDGGSYDSLDSTKFITGNKADGGTYAFTDGYTYDGGSFTDLQDVHVLNQWITLDVAVDDIVITGIKASKNINQEIQDTEENETITETTTVDILEGTDDYVVSLVENLLILGNEDEAVKKVASALLGGRMRHFAGEHHNYPVAEFMDCACIVDKKGNIYVTVLTDINYTWFDKTTFSNSVEARVKNNSQYQMTPAQIFAKTQQMIALERNSREIFQKHLAEELASKSGLYFSSTTNTDGSHVYYLHNQNDEPDLNGVFPQSTIVWKMNAYALGVSNDGGKTYPYILDNSGNAILNRLNIQDLSALNATIGSWFIGQNSIYSENGNIVSYKMNPGYTYGVDYGGTVKPYDFFTRINSGRLELFHNWSGYGTAGEANNSTLLTGGQGLFIGENGKSVEIVNGQVFADNIGKIIATNTLNNASIQAGIDLNTRYFTLTPTQLPAGVYTFELEGGGQPSSNSSGCIAARIYMGPAATGVLQAQQRQLCNVNSQYWARVGCSATFEVDGKTNVYGVIASHYAFTASGYFRAIQLR